MRNYVPRFIESAWKAGRTEGSFTGSVLFVDIAGFTSLMETAFSMGDRGAEMMSRELRRVFDPPVTAVLSRGGSISTFAGDAFTALFPGDETGAAARAAASEIGEAFTRERDTATGDLAFDAKGGIARGRIDWGICETGSGLHAYYFRGGPVDEAARLEKRAGRGAFPSSWDDPVRDGPVPTEDRPGPPGTANDPATLEAFVPGEVLKAGERPEIRPVVSVFAGFEGPVGTHDAVSRVVRAAAASLGGGTFDKLDFGDKGMYLLCHFGAPRAVERPVEAALNFALDLEARLQGDLPGVGVRAGVASGLAWSGITGGSLRNEWTCLGGGVNLAARLMAQTRRGEVLLGGRAREEAAAHFDLDELGDLRVKGLRDRVPVASVLRRGAQRAPRGYAHAMVGREEELATLQDRLAVALAGRFAGVVSIRGEAGVGKTRLVHEFRRAAAGSLAGPHWVRLPCLERGADLQPIRIWLEDLLGVDAFSPPGQKRVRIETVLDGVGRDAGLSREDRDDLRQKASYLAAVVGCEWEGSRFEELGDPRLRYENQIWALRDLVRAMAADRPVVLEVEDAHWLDPSTADWLARMTRGADDLPLLVLMSARPTEGDEGPRAAFDEAVPVHEIDLRPLDTGRAADLFEGLTGQRPDPALAASLLEATLGNPFFLEQMSLHFAEAGLLAEGPEGAVLREQQGERLPQSLETVLLARFDRLEADLRDGLKHAATLGVRFLRRVLEDLLGRSEGFTGRASEVLPGGERAGLIGREGDGGETLSGEDAYLFRHALMQQAAYELQPPSVRARLHGLAAEVIEEHFPDRGEFYGELAHHWAGAGNGPKEIDYLERAAERAEQAFLNSEAQGYYRRLRRRLDEATETDRRRGIEAALGLGRVLRLVGEWEEAMAVFQEALAAAEEVEDRHLVVDARSRLGNLYRERGRAEEAMDLLEAAVDLAGTIENPKLLARVYGDLGNVRFHLGDYPGAREGFERLLEISEQIGDDNGRARAIGSMGNVHECMGDNAAAMDCFERRLAISRETGDRHGQAAAIGSMGIIHNNLGNYDEAIACHRDFLALVEELGDKIYKSVAVGNLGSSYSGKGDLDRAMECHEEHLKISEELADTAGRANALINMAAVHAERGDLAEAMGCYDQGLDLAREAGMRLREATALQGRGKVRHKAGDLQEAAADFAAAARLNREMELGPAEADALVLLARANLDLAEAGKDPAPHREAAREAADRARELASKTGREDLLAELDRLPLS